MAGGLTGLQKIVGNLSVTVTLTAQTLQSLGVSQAS